MAGIVRNIGIAVSVGATSVITTVGLSATSSSTVQAQAVTQGLDDSLVRERLDQILLESKRQVLGLEHIGEYEGLSEEDVSID